MRIGLAFSGGAFVPRFIIWEWYVFCAMQVCLRT
jgi:hypothetical protein